MHILDTNILIEVEKHNPHIIKILGEIALQEDTTFCITAPTYSEFLFGLQRRSEMNKKKAIEHLEIYPLLHTTKESSSLLAEIKHDLEKNGKPIPLFDLFIASIAIANNATILTGDVHFKNISKLNVVLIDIR